MCLPAMNKTRVIMANIREHRRGQILRQFYVWYRWTTLCRESIFVSFYFYFLLAFDWHMFAWAIVCHSFTLPQKGAIHQQHLFKQWIILKPVDEWHFTEKDTISGHFDDTSAKQNQTHAAKTPKQEWKRMWKHAKRGWLPPSKLIRSKQRMLP